MASAPRSVPVNLDLLRLFDRVAVLGTIAAAARELRLSPSLATRRLAALERSLGTRLFQRTTRSIKLTEGGGIALKWSRSVLAGHAQVADDLAAVQGRPSGQVRVALSEYVALTFLPTFLSAFAPRYPEIRFVFTTTDSVVKLVEEGYDVAVHSGLIPDASFVGVRLRDVQRVLCASPDYLARRGTPGSVEDLARHACLVHAPTEPANWFFRRGRRLVGQPLDPYLQADDYLVLAEMARRGLGILRISRNVVREDLATGRLVQVLPEYQCVYPTGELPGIWVIYPNRRMLYRTRVFVDELTAFLEKALA